MMYHIVMVSCRKKLCFVFLHWEGTGTYKSHQTQHRIIVPAARRKREGALAFKFGVLCNESAVWCLRRKFHGLVPCHLCIYYSCVWEWFLSIINKLLVCAGSCFFRLGSGFNVLQQSLWTVKLLGCVPGLV